MLGGGVREHVAPQPTAAGEQDNDLQKLKRLHADILFSLSEASRSCSREL